MRTILVIALAGVLVGSEPPTQEPSISEVCVADHARLCEQTSIQSDGAMRCLMGHRQDVSQECRSALDARRQSVLARVRKACTNEIAAYCAGDHSETPLRCLRHHDAQLSPTCRATLPRWMS